MTFTAFIYRSLRFYWRTHLGVLLGTALTCAILTGALVVGDSVRDSLERLALARLGRTEFALASGDRFFREELAKDLGSEVAPLIMLRGTVSVPDRHQRASEVQIVGVDDRFWRLGTADSASPTNVSVNARLAERLGLRGGDEIVVRVEKPSLLSRDAALAGKADDADAFRLRVESVADDAHFGRFSLQANQVPPLTVFVPLTVMQRELQQPGKANVLLAAVDVREALRQRWTLADAGLELRELPGQLELRTDGVFLEPAVVQAVPPGLGVLTYFVNELRNGDRATPYSFVTAVGTEDGIVINSWLADDLGAKVGDELTVQYFVMAERRELREETARLRVSRIVPVEKDDSWMPAFPGLADAENCREWKSGIPIALDRIRPKDEAYWKQYRGTPKAFVSLATGQRLWSNRFGNLTAIRYPLGSITAAGLKKKLDPATLGLFFVPVRDQALAASRQSQDFGQLFIGFSFFLIVAALLLTAMLFVFNLEMRHEEVGLLRALGFRVGQVRRLQMLEGISLAVLGTLVGAVAGAFYTKLTLVGLTTVWRGAVGATQFRYHAEPATLALGASLSLVVAVVAMWFVQRQQTRRAPAALLATAGGDWISPRRQRFGLWIGGLACIGAVGMLVTARAEKNAEIFFSAGALLLIAGIGFSHWLIGNVAQGPASRLSHYGLRNAARRRGRSLTTISVLASGVFLVVAVNAFRQDAQHDARDRASGTGGFACWAQSALPVYASLPGTVSLRVHDGDDASCLNLNRAQQPRVLGVNPAELAKRGAFGGKWELLNQTAVDGAVPAIGDEQTVVWALGKKLGDAVMVRDDRGQLFPVRIVGVLPSSILQGSLLISERNFVQRFPAVAGYRAFLMDEPLSELARTLEDRGFEAVPAAQRLAEFMTVENTYLGIFQALGGLGLLLGSLGLGIVVLRNVLERRGELALLQAVGFRRLALQRLVLSEHWLLIVLGLAIGVGAALVAVWPSHGGSVPVVTLLVLAVGGLAWSWLAARVALRGPLLAALRNE